MIKIIELLAVCVSAAACGYGALHLVKKEVPKYFKLYVCASACYMLEELWVIVNSLFGSGSQDGLITVRLFGFFGCLCFMLSANMNGFDKAVDEGQNRKAKAQALAAPVILLAFYAVYTFLSADTLPIAVNMIGLAAISPALPASYLSLKHLLLPKDALGLLKIIRGIDILALVFYVVNYIYPLLDLYLSQALMSIYDLILSGMLFGMIVLCRKGAEKWKALIL